MNRSATLGFVLGFLGFVAAGSPSLAVQLVNYGDFDDIAEGGAIKYSDVTESTSTDEVPLFGPPEIELNDLEFDPTTFGASGGGGADLVDGQLNFQFETLPGAGITSFFFDEGGNYTLFGAGTEATQVAFGLAVSLRVLEIDGEPVAPFTIEGSDFGSANIVADPGLSQPWDLSVFIDLGSAMGTKDIDFDDGVTKGEVVITDTLVAVSENPSTLAFIAKTDFLVVPGGDLVPERLIPEPLTATLTLSVAAVAATRRRRR